MINKYKVYSWYLKFSIFLAAWGIFFFVYVILDSFKLVVGNSLEGLAFPIIGPYLLLQIPLLIFNLIIFILLYIKKVEKIALNIPVIFIINNFVVLLYSMEIPLIQHIITLLFMALLLVSNLIIIIKLMRKK